jgi:hypothetical protein
MVPEEGVISEHIRMYSICRLEQGEGFSLSFGSKSSEASGFSKGFFDE